MAISINRVTLLGRCAQDPELRYTADGTPVCTLNVATSYSYQREGEWEEVPQFTRCVLWRNRAEYVARHVSKGEYIYVEGRLQTRKWEGKDGQTRYTTEVQVDNFVIPQNKGQSIATGQEETEGLPQAPESQEEDSLEDLDTDNMPF